MTPDAFDFVRDLADNPALTAHSGNPAEICAALADALQSRIAAALAMQAAAQAGDDDGWDRAAAAHDAASDAIGDLKARLWELEERAGWDEWRDERRNVPIVL